MTAFVSSSVQAKFVGTGRVALSGTGAADFDAWALLLGGAGAREDLNIRSRKWNTAAPAAQSRTSSPTTAGSEVRWPERRSGPNWEAAASEVGRGLATWAAERMNLLLPDSGA